MVLLAVANMLSKSRESDFKRGISNVMFAFLNGESFDYIGSSNMVYNMKNSAFPSSDEAKGTAKVEDNGNRNASDANITNASWPKIDLDSLKFVIELGQLNSENSELYAHVDTAFDDADLMENLKTTALNNDVKIREASNKNRGLPPASLQSILKEKRSVPGILVSNFDQQYSNSYYHSPYDNFTLLNNYDYSKGENQPIVQHLAKGKLYLLSYST